MKQAEVTYQFLSGGGELGELIRSMDWSKTPLGEVDCWPQSLRSALSICLGSSFPIALYWGRELTLLYNDAWSPIPGNKHPWALGRPGRQVWPELWDTIGPMFENVIKTGEATRSKDELLPMQRNGYTEECYFDYTFSPIRGEGGSVEGIFNAVIETTYRVISERRTHILQSLVESTNKCRSVNEVGKLVVKALKGSDKDLPFFLLYRLGEKSGFQQEAHLIASTGIPLSEEISPKTLSLLEGEEDQVWPLSEVLKKGQSKYLSDLSVRFGKIPEGVWPEPINEALLVPVKLASSGLSGFVIAGISSRRELDKEYQGFIESIASHISTAFINARAYEEERQRAEALTEIDKVKTAFFSNVSHEFRTPLTLILGPLEEILSQAEELPPQISQNLEATHRNALRLQKLVNSLLEFSRLEAGRVQAHYVPVNLGALTKDLTSGFRTIIEKAGLQFTVECESLGCPAYVDREMWEKIVLNLLSNAYKYTLKGSIQVSLKREGDWAVLSVQDTGVGIPKEELPRMFERFHRVPTTVGRTHEGTGIGLSMVHELVKLHQGQIQVQSTRGQGSTFTVSIPLGKAHLPAEQVSEQPVQAEGSYLLRAFVQEVEPLLENETSNHKWMAPDQGFATEADSLAQLDKETNILIVDDNYDMRAYLQRLLEPHFLVRTAANGRSALDRIARRIPDLIISDVMMPVMDGKELLIQLKKKPDTARIPVILLSARAGEEARIDGLDAGADDYLVKPFSGKELLSKIKSQIKIARVRNHNETQLRNLFMQVPMAVSITRGPDHVIELANERALEIWDKTAADVLNKPAMEVFPELRGTALEGIANHVYSEGQRFVTAESPVTLRRNGTLETIFAQFVYEPLRDETGKVTGIMTVGHEITDLVRARQLAQTSAQELEKKVRERTAELEKKNQELKRTNQELEQFAYVSSHDLQEPLRKIQTFSDMVLAKMKDPNFDAASYLQKINASAQRMSILIKDLLNYSRVNKAEQYFEPVNLNQVLENVLGDFEVLIRQKNAQLFCSPLPTIMGVPVQLNQLFYNLISNALKFSERPPVIRISARTITSPDQTTLLPRQAEGHYTELTIEDNGIGFSQEYVDKIFTIFQRLNDRQKYNGTGIGLAICKKIVENHGGYITATGVEGKGATFTMYLPIEVPVNA
ncbi:ATP-binding protein [Telluribacter sp. SYSU D00476]|uniref:ATP-binding protein n=1 Tax=Telluribacter sp. SYSU D00476 TaxID=2811430 RepID=UPI001FF5426E|nr:ATP-binding protein [Telluribacter sp. SYSU D00476]